LLDEAGQHPMTRAARNMLEPMSAVNSPIESNGTNDSKNKATPLDELRIQQAVELQQSVINKLRAFENKFELMETMYERKIKERRLDDSVIC